MSSSEAPSLWKIIKLNIRRSFRKKSASYANRLLLSRAVVLLWSPKLSTQVSKVLKVLSRIVSSRQTRRNDGYIAANTSLTDAPVDDVFAASSDDLENSKMSLPPRYRFRDLLLGDFAFTDDGQRWVTSISVVIRYSVLPPLSTIIHYASCVALRISFIVWLSLCAR